MEDEERSQESELATEEQERRAFNGSKQRIGVATNRIGVSTEISNKQKRMNLQVAFICENLLDKTETFAVTVDGRCLNFKGRSFEVPCEVEMLGWRKFEKLWS